MAFPVVFNKTMAAASSNSIATSQSPGSSALTLTSSSVTIDTALSTNQAIGRRVILTSGGNDSGINWTVVGTNASKSVITDVFAGSNGGAAQSNFDFVTVTSIKPSGAVASTIIAGTNGVGSSPWYTINWHATSVINVAVAVELVSGAANFTVQYTYDDPNNTGNSAAYSIPFVPLAFNSSQINAVASTSDGVFAMPIAAVRLLINSGTGQLRMRILQSGIG